jgi:hypothetical protein
MLNRRVGEAFRVKDDDDACAHVITVTRAKVGRAKGGSHQGFALKPAENAPLNVGSVSGTPQNSENPAQTEEILSANVAGKGRQGIGNVGGPQMSENIGEFQHPPTSPTSDGEDGNGNKISARADVMAEAEIDRLAALDGWNPNEDESELK